MMQHASDARPKFRVDRVEGTTNHGNVGNQVAVQNVAGSVHYANNYFHAESARAREYRSNRQKVDPDTVDDDAILGSFAFSHMLDRRNDIENAHAGTCEWIFETEEFEVWKKQATGLLWIKGKPGSGKSTLMAVIYDRIRSHEGADAVVCLDFFFSARGVLLQHTPLGMFRSLLNQIFLKIPVVRPLIRSIYQERCASFGSAPLSWEWKQPELERLLSRCIMESAKSHKIDIFIDALDETGEENAEQIAHFFHELNDISHVQHRDVKICISSRHYPIPANIRGLEIFVEDHNTAGIQKFVHDRLSTMGLNTTHKPQTWQEIERELVRRARGVFHWARLALALVGSSVSDGRAPHFIRLALDEMPDELGEIYDHIIRNVIKVRNRPESFLLLQWVCLAERPLSLAELRHALALNELISRPRRIRCHDLNNFIEFDEVMQKRMTASSGGLLEVVANEEESSYHQYKPRVGTNEIKKRIQTVQVIHQTVNEYLLRSGLSLLYSMIFSVSTATVSATLPRDPVSTIRLCHSTLYWSCLVYIYAECPKDPKRAFTKPFALEAIIEQLPLLDYAATNMLTHAEKAARVGDRDRRLEIDLLDKATYVLGSVSAHNRCDWPRIDTTVLHMASYAGLADIVSETIKDNTKLDGRDSSGYAPIHLAALRGHEEVAKILYHAGADLSRLTDRWTRGGIDQTPMSVAAGNGHIPFVEFLLGHGAEGKFGTVSGQSALQAAAAKGMDSMVQVLLDAKFDMNVKDNRTRPAIVEAARAGHKAIVSMLIDAGADINIVGENCDTALAAATLNGDEAIVSILLDAGADTNIIGNAYGSALIAAIEGGHVTMVHRLLNAGADIDFVSRGFGTALTAAMGRQKALLAHILLDAGADVNIGGGGYGTALIAAAEDNDQLMVSRLLDTGADVNLAAGHYGTALKAAAERGHATMVSILLEAGADPNVEAGHYSTAVQAARANGHAAIVQVLEENSRSTKRS